MQSIAHRALSRARAFLVDVVREGINGSNENQELRTNLSDLDADYGSLAKENTALETERDQLRAEVKRLNGCLIQVIGPEGIEPTWVCALLGDEAWSEEKRCSYNAGVTWMKSVGQANIGGLFPRSAWDTLVRLGRAR